MDREEFRHLYDTYYPVVLRHVKSLIRQPGDIEEAVQDVFVRVYQNYDQFRGEAQFQTWLLAIARNVVYDIWRRNQRRQRQSTIAIADVPEAELGTAPAADPLATVTAADELQSAWRCIDALPPSMRMVVMYRSVHNFSTIETAQIMAWSPTRVRVTHSRALRKLRQLWAAASEGGAVNSTQLG